ncbi:DUF4394 domain-containing protein [bacterium]|jgi:hypothetical protein|nr:DUF4394 domain-containing protein [Verrucomicrobiota bacterium]MDA7632660.1 DUF4394 domain-containing protein [bacterium]
MTNVLRLVAICTIQLFVLSESVRAQSFIALKPGSNSKILDVSVVPNFSVSDIANTGVQSLSGIDIQPGTGTLFGSTGFNDTGNIYTIDPTSGASTLVGASGFQAVSGLAFDLNGDLYGTASLFGNTVTERLIKINTTTGVGTTIGTFQAFGIDGIDGIAIHPTTGIMYATSVISSTGADPLFTINKTTGAATLIGTLTEPGTGNAAPGAIVGLAFDSSGNLYGSTGGGDGNILAIDINSLTFTVAGDATTSGSVSDLVFYNPVAVPEPTSVWITMGLLAVGVAVRRRTRRE